MFKYINSYLAQILNNEISLETVYHDALLVDKSIHGIYSYACPMESIENDAIYSALYLTRHFPIAQTVLYCNEDTSEEEILSFNL